MGLGLFKIESRKTKKSHVALRALAFVIITSLPVNAFADAAANAQLPVVAAATPSQAASQGQASSTNSMASMLSKAAGVLSMAAGGLYIAKGVQQMQCCTQGCTGSGTAAEATKAGNESSAAKSGEAVTKSLAPRQPINYFKLRFPDEANSCPAPKARLRSFSLLELFRPVKVEASVSGCLDAGISIATGGLMLLTGIMGLAAASQSGQMADTTGLNSTGMDSLGGGATAGTPNSTNNGSGPNGTSGTSGTGSGGTGGTSGTNGTSASNSSGLGSTVGATNPIKLDPALLRTGKANDIMNQFESQFGIPRDQFANGVIAGQDPRNMFNSAPKNALTNDDMNKAISGARAMSDSEKAAALANSPMGDVQRDIASKMGTGAGDAQYEMKMGGGGTGGSGLVAFGGGKKADSEIDALNLPTAEAAKALGVSPEVQAAIAAKQLEDRKNGLTELTIFQVVHAKYREKSKMIFGFDPDGLPKGGGNGI